MCGIGGLLAGPGASVSRIELDSLGTAISHRGPDGQGSWFSPDGRCGLVHRRLAILDTSEGGHQPMRSAGDGRYTIVYNGEIFNFLELRAQLEDKGHAFRGESDTEVILAAWAEWGEQMLHRFNGMWALAIHDAANGELFLSRDRFGIKPMLYAQRDGRLAFASEMRALRQLPWVSGDLDERVARRLLFDPFSIEASAFTLFRDIHRLPAGHQAWWRNGKLEVRRWWCTADHLIDVPAEPERQRARFHELFHDAVRLRMRSDVSIGTSLSGGFDSSAIVCEMSHVASETQPHLREATDWRHAFIASFPGRSNDETPLALEAAARAQVIPHQLDLSEVNDTSIVDQVLTDLDEIYISLPDAPWQIYREMRRHGTLVSIDGHGADELMGGYRQAGAAFSFTLRNHLTGLVSRSALAERGLDHLRMARLTHQGHAFLRDHRWHAPPGLELPADRDALPASWGPLNRRLYRLFHSTVLPTILRNFDRLSMAHGIEVRMPFMDWRLVCFVMSLPDAAKLDPIGSKAVARHAMAGRMPDSIRISQRKVGFNSPMPEWMNATLGNWALQVLARPDDRFDALVDKPALCRRISELTQASSWTWESVGRLWPYINLKWLIDRVSLPSRTG